MTIKSNYYQNPKLQQADIENLLIDGINKPFQILDLIDNREFNIPNPRVIYEINKKYEEDRKRHEQEELNKRIQEAERLRIQKKEEEKVRRSLIDEERRILEKEIKAVIYEDIEERDLCRDAVATLYQTGFQLSLNSIVYRTQSKINSIIRNERSYELQLKILEVGRNYLGKAKLIDEYYNKHFYSSDYRSNYNTRSISIIKDSLSSLRLDEGTVVKGSKRIIKLDEEEIEKYSEKIIQIENKLSQNNSKDNIFKKINWKKKRE